MPGAGSVLSKYIGSKPSQWLITESSAMTESHHGRGEVDEGDVQLRRWSRLLSWLGSHGMDLSPSAIRVERRPRAGIFILLSQRCPRLTFGSL